MSTPAHADEPRREPGSSRADGRARSFPVPSPPGGHPLRIDPDARQAPTPAPLPVVEEESAGGLVIEVDDGRPHAAVIARRNRGGRLEWCLPKGHLEGTETPAQAAVREIAEETGIDGAVQVPLGVIDYWFTGSDRRVHKVVHHFLLRATGGYLTVEGDPDGEAEDVAWIAVDDLAARLAYPNERRIALVAQNVLAGRPTRLRTTVESRVTRTIVRLPGPRSFPDPS
ncbi:NUDIX hydrolase [Cellulosimicrobium arenosum]|uniref:NUDIX hydrolase n=1 Tax=Cellulosimicrobium arenosum TaxID=2708133 RepID=A0A927PFY1_9MICO|nr:NUDIX hydrolase [Cellulosimicrobium arenosum]MBD8079970.1 NUDIX hydrolase [Cellulosimicrobium arenosum]